MDDGCYKQGHPYGVAGRVRIRVGIKAGRVWHPFRVHWFFGGGDPEVASAATLRLPSVNPFGFNSEIGRRTTICEPIRVQFRGRRRPTCVNPFGFNSERGRRPTICAAFGFSGVWPGFNSGRQVRRVGATTRNVWKTPIGSPSIDCANAQRCGRAGAGSLLAQVQQLTLNGLIMKPWLLVCAVLALVGCNKNGPGGAESGGGPRKLTIALMPKSKGNAYFVSCKNGADRAAKELGVDLIFDGPTDPDPARQNEMVENWITLGVDVMAVACENKDGISTALRKARSKGVKVITYDSDATPDARDFFVNQATPEGIANALMDEAGRLCGNQGEFAIITASLTAANMNEWQKFIELRRASKYPDLKMVALRPCDDLKDRAQTEATTLLSAYPNLKLLMAICSPAVPGAAEAVKQAGKVGKVKVIGLGLPSENRSYVKDGVTDTVILWKTEDLGYLTVCAAQAVATGALKAGTTSLQAGRLGAFAVEGDNILLGKPFLFTKDNIDQFDF